MDGTVAVVTGGSAGIGRATALAFAARGARVVVADVEEEGARETMEMLAGEGGEAVFVRTDVSSRVDVERMVETALSRFGRLDYAFNNAGIVGEAAATEECTEENWDRTIAINLTGVWLCMKHEISVMLDGGGGAIVNCASIAGLRGFPSIPAYTASKHGVLGLTKSAALENAERGLRINAICPGAVDTPMIDRYTHGDADARARTVAAIPMGRMGRPEEIARAVVWMCSDEASFMTGEVFVVDGGQIAR
jgi:NAD(P)-dependent dehydrogenase (short-subunit alcohol dehydrogenase family)